MKNKLEIKMKNQSSSFLDHSKANHSSVAKQRSWQGLLGGLFTFALLAGAVFTTSSVAQLSYQVAQLDQQQHQLQQYQQLLQEKLAQAQSIKHPVAYAQREGFSSQAQPDALAVLDVTPELAQLIQ